MKLEKLPGPVVSVDWLSENAKNRHLIILDATLGKAAFPVIPGTRFFDLEKQFCDRSSPLPHMMPSPEQFEAGARALGVNDSSLIVIYDEKGIFSSPRARWMFKAMGHDEVAILDGGLPAWLGARLPVEEEPSEFRPGNFTARAKLGYFCNLAEFKPALKDPKSLVLDARSEGRFNGKEPEPRPQLRSGHMEGAVSLPYTEVLKHGRLLPVSDLLRVLESRKLDDKKLFFTCGSGVTACIIGLAAELCGFSPITVYDGSWTEWVLSGL